MPPARKRARLSPTASTNAGDTPTKPTSSPGTKSSSPPPSVVDPWTPRQLSTLFKALLTHAAKPTGPHKHMHMISLAQQIWSHEGRPGATQPHLSTAGIWAKLDTLYDLAALDEREERYVDDMENRDGNDSEEETSAAEAGEGTDANGADAVTREFTLEKLRDAAEFHEEMMQRRIRGDDDSGSDEEDEEEEDEEDGADEEEEEDEEEAEASEAATSPAPTVESHGRKGSVAKPRATRAVRRSSRRAGSVSTSADIPSPATQQEDEGEDDEEGGDGSQANGSKASSPPARTRRSARSTAAATTKAKPKGRRR